MPPNPAWADGILAEAAGMQLGNTPIQVNPTQVSEQMKHPVKITQESSKADIETRPNGGGCCAGFCCGGDDPDTTCGGAADVGEDGSAEAAEVEEAVAGGMAAAAAVV